MAVISLNIFAFIVCLGLVGAGGLPASQGIKPETDERTGSRMMKKRSWKLVRAWPSSEESLEHGRLLQTSQVQETVVAQAGLLA
jgi:hypothetical protein